MRFINDPSIWIKELFIESGLSYNLSSLLSTITLVVIVIILSWLANFIAKFLINSVVARIVKRTTSQWDDIFLEQKVFTRMSHFAPGLVIWFMAGWALSSYPGWMIAVHKMAYIYMVLAGMIVLLAFIDAWHRIYNTLAVSQHRHLKGYVQLVKILVIIIAILIVISVVFRRDIGSIVAGLGAMAAVLILVFRDTLLGLVASIQLSVDDMVRVGDWITAPRRDVDGVVVDITLNNVKVQNFDKSVVNIPTYALINESFMNWKGMEQSGLRMIKRAIYIDMNSIRFLDRKMKEKLCSVPLLKEFIETFESERRVYGTLEPEDLFFNASQLTNLGVFRYYAETFIKQHPDIDNNQPFIVRHRPPEENGLALQIYGFSSKNQMVPYENVQSEIFEHLFAIMNEFGLKVFQQPTGSDILALSIKNDLL